MAVLYRAATIRLFGPDPFALSLWHTLLIMSLIFHHSNLDLSPELDRRLRRFVVTPRMHGIHHSDYEQETDSNWSSLFTVWDFLHRTSRSDVPQSAITIGVPAYGRPEDVTLPRVMVMPFAERRYDWMDDFGRVKVSRTSHARGEMNAEPRTKNSE